MIFDNQRNKNVALECKEFIKYLGILTDNNLTWKHHIDHITIKISRTIGLISKLRHLVPKHTLIKFIRVCFGTHSYSISCCTSFELWADSLGPGT